MSSNTSIIDLYNWEGILNQLLVQYQQAYMNYISLLSNSHPTQTVYNLINLNEKVQTYCSGNSSVIKQPLQSMTADDCQALCSKTSNCNAYDLSYPDNNGNYKCTLYQGNVTALSGNANNYGCFQQVLSPDSTIEETLKYLNKLNAELIIVNQQIHAQLSSLEPTAGNLAQENKNKLEDAKKRHMQLLQEQDNIYQMQQEYNTTSADKYNSMIFFKHEYAQYIFWFFLFCIIGFLTVKYVFFPTVTFNVMKFIFWSVFICFIIISIIFSNYPSGFLIMCVLVSLFVLFHMGIITKA